MHKRMLELVIDRCRQRAREGDCTAVKPFSVENLEDAIIELAGWGADSRAAHGYPSLGEITTGAETGTGAGGGVGGVRLRRKNCILNCDSPSFPADDYERRQCGCAQCVKEMSPISRMEAERDEALRLLKSLHDWFMQVAPQHYNGCGLWIDVDITLREAGRAAGAGVGADAPPTEAKDNGRVELRGGTSE